jgi:hypothetical protein
VFKILKKRANLIIYPFEASIPLPAGGNLAAGQGRAKIEILLEIAGPIC